MSFNVTTSTGFCYILELVGAQMREQKTPAGKDGASDKSCRGDGGAEARREGADIAGTRGRGGNPLCMSQLPPGGHLSAIAPAAASFQESAAVTHKGSPGPIPNECQLTFKSAGPESFFSFGWHQQNSFGEDGPHRILRFLRWVDNKICGAAVPPSAAGRGRRHALDSAPWCPGLPRPFSRVSRPADPHFRLREQTDGHGLLDRRCLSAFV